MKKLAVLLLGMSLFAGGCAGGKKSEAEFKSEIAQLKSTGNFMGACDLSSANACLDFHIDRNLTAIDLTQFQSVLRQACISQPSGTFRVAEKCNLNNAIAFCKFVKEDDGVKVEIDAYLGPNGDLAAAKRDCASANGKFIER